MEVHHHSHHPKKWKEYITEFLMLFLAVTLGFLAENLREVYVEKERSHELISSFIRDVELNVVLMDSLIQSNKKSLLKSDSIALYIVKTKKDIDLNVVYEIPAVSYRYLSNNDTYDQMKSSGSLRYVKDTVLLRKMIEYSNLSKATEFRSVIQEYDYTKNEFQNTLNKFIPIEIAANKHSTAITSIKFHKLFSSDSNHVKFFQETKDLVNGKTFMLDNSILTTFKKELVPVIYRKTSLMYASINFLYMTRRSAQELLQYYKTHNQH
jgi:hypothetical protein